MQKAYGLTILGNMSSIHDRSKKSPSALCTFPCECAIEYGRGAMTRRRVDFHISRASRDAACLFAFVLADVSRSVTWICEVEHIANRLLLDRLMSPPLLRAEIGHSQACRSNCPISCCAIIVKSDLWQGTAVDTHRGLLVHCLSCYR